MPSATYQAWLALYSAVGLVVAICALAAIIKTIVDYSTGALKLPLASRSNWAFAPARLWWRWQINYLTGAPVILLIAGLYAHHIGFGVLLDV